MIVNSTNNKYLITHFVQSPSNEIGWKKISFVCYESEGDFFFLNYDRELKISKEEVRQKSNLGYYKEIYNPILTSTSNYLWITSNNEIWLADRKKPFSFHSILVDSSFSFDEIHSNITKKQLALIGLSSKILTKVYPSPIKNSIRILLKKLKEDHTIFANFQTDNFYIFDQSYIPELDDSIDFLKDHLKTVTKRLVSQDPTKGMEEYYEVYDNQLYYEVPTFYLYPYFLDEERIEKFNAGIIPYGFQSTIAILIHKKNSFYKSWSRNRVNQYIKSFSENSNSLDKHTEKEHSEGFLKLSIMDKLELDKQLGESQFDIGRQWLKDLIDDLSTKETSEIHSIRGYVFRSILKQFTIRHFGNVNKILRSLRPEIELMDFSNDSNPFKAQKGTRPNFNKILLLDPADALGYTNLGKALTDNLFWKDYDTVFLEHQLNIPVGIGYSLFALPLILNDDNWEKIQKEAIYLLSGHIEILEKVGINLFTTEPILKDMQSKSIEI